MRRLLLSLSIMVALSWLTGCASVSQPADPNTFYRREFRIKAAGREGVGNLVLPKQASYQIELSTGGEMDLFTFTTCHREDPKERAGDRVDYTFTPAPGIEDQGGCPAVLGGFEQKKGRHAWGFIDFETDDVSLPAALRCNGRVIAANGVSICESAEGLLQEISFPVAVRVSPASVTCDLPKPHEGTTFRYPIPKGECVFAFMELTAPYRVHRHNTYGYQKILLREAN